MSKAKSVSTLHKLKVAIKLDLEQVEAVFCDAINKASIAKSAKAESAELARIDMMQGETIIYFRGDKKVVDSLKTALCKKSSKAKPRLSKTTISALAKAL